MSVRQHVQPKPQRELECQYWPVFTVTRPGLSVVVSVDRDRHHVQVRTTGTRSQTSLPVVRTITRGVSRADLKRIVGTAARLSNQFQRLIVAAVDPKP